MSKFKFNKKPVNNKYMNRRTLDGVEAISFIDCPICKSNTYWKVRVENTGKIEFTTHSWLLAENYAIDNNLFQVTITEKRECNNCGWHNITRQHLFTPPPKNIRVR